MPFTARRAALRELLLAADVDALLVTDLVNIRYLTGFTGSNAALLVDAGGDAASRFGTDGRYRTQAQAQVPDLERIEDRATAVAVAAAAHGLGVRRLGFESDAVSVDAHAALDAAADAALADLLAADGLRPGRTERDVALDLENRMRGHGAQGPAFETIVAAPSTTVRVMSEW